MELSESQRRDLEIVLAQKQQDANESGAPQPVMLNWAIRDTQDEIRSVALLIREYAQSQGYNLVVGSRPRRVDLDSSWGAEGGGGHPLLWMHPGR